MHKWEKRKASKVGAHETFLEKGLTILSVLSTQARDESILFPKEECVGIVEWTEMQRNEWLKSFALLNGLSIVLHARRKSRKRKLNAKSEKN